MTNPMTPLKKVLREEISEILVKWHMPTRQIAINEIIELFNSKQKEFLESTQMEMGYEYIDENTSDFGEKNAFYINLGISQCKDLLKRKLRDF